MLQLTPARFIFGRWLGAQNISDESADADSSPVRLKFSGIRVMYFGKGEVVLYWNEKLNKMVAIATGD